MPETITRYRTTGEIKALERVAILRVLLLYGPQKALDVVERVNTECDHPALEELPPISRRGIGQKLRALWMDGLVSCDSADPQTWSISDAGELEAIRRLGPVRHVDLAMERDQASAYADTLRSALRKLIAAAEEAERVIDTGDFADLQPIFDAARAAKETLANG